ncbi:MAG: 1-acyl-sn-glycerol-3-phosphate acyltransferase [Nitrospirae bacterium]|nr:1-acyl-sn-glycerol-3-phosphate acyltransferase [Nitrospirota bacterium]
MEIFKDLKKDGIVLIGNHQNGNFDRFLINACVPLSYYLRIKCFRIMAVPQPVLIRKIYRPLLWIAGAYNIYKCSGNLEKSLHKTIKIFRKGHNIILFPEGTIFPEFDPRNARPGIAYLAKKLNPLIVPVFIENINNITLKDFLLRKRKVKISVGKPFYYNNIESSGDLRHEAFIIAGKIAEIKDKGIYA